MAIGKKTSMSFTEGLSNRTKNCLENNYGRLNDLVLYDLLDTRSDAEFLRIPNFGKTGMKELRNVHKVMASLREKDIDIDLVADNERLRREIEDMRMLLVRFVTNAMRYCNADT